MSGTDRVVDGLQEFWSEKGISLACPVCRHQEFSIDRGGELYVPNAVDLVSGERGIHPNLIRSYAVYCVTCGFVMNFMQSVVDAHHATVQAHPTDE